MGKAVISVYLDGIADGNEDWIRQVGTDDSLDSLWPPDYDPFEYADKQQRTRLGAKEQRASRKHSGTMVALVPSDGSWCHQDDPHVTLVYAGELAPDDPTIERLLGICRELAAQTHVMAVPVTGTAVFGEGNDQVDVLTLEKTPELVQLRAALEWANGSQYTDYKPHATIGPVGPAGMDPIPDQLVLTSLWMVTGDDEWTWPLPRESRTAGLGGQFAPGGTRTQAFKPMETRAYGLGGQFAKGGGRIPGRGGPAGAGSGVTLGAGQVDDFMTAAGASIRPHLVPDGKGGYQISAERAALHEEILAKALAGVEGGLDNPQFVMLGGGPGAGKSTTSTAVGVPPPVEKGGKAAWADPDGMKQALPEYDPKNPSIVHEESSYLAKVFTERALAMRADVVIDGVGDNPGSVAAKLAGARAAGYKRTRAAYTTVETEVAQERNAQRARSVAPSLLAAKHAAVSRNFESIASLFDEAELWYNPQGGSAVRVASKNEAGSALTVHDPAQWSAFLAKGA